MDQLFEAVTNDMRARQPRAVYAAYVKVMAELRTRDLALPPPSWLGRVSGSGRHIGIAAAYIQACWCALRRNDTVVRTCDVQMAASKVYTDVTCPLELKIRWMVYFAWLACRLRHSWDPEAFKGVARDIYRAYDRLKRHGHEVSTPMARDRRCHVT